MDDQESKHPQQTSFAGLGGSLQGKAEGAAPCGQLAPLLPWILSQPTLNIPTIQDTPKKPRDKGMDNFYCVANLEDAPLKLLSDSITVYTVKIVPRACLTKCSERGLSVGRSPLMFALGGCSLLGTLCSL